MADKKSKANNTALLAEIRETYTRYRDYWRPIYEEGKKDMKYLAGDPWDPADRKEREENGRPCMTLDELHQYVNQLINDVRMSKLGIKVDPKGAGATSLTASTRQGIIRNIEYESNAQTAYTTAFEGSAQRSYGFAKVVTKYVDDKSFDQIPRIVRIPNPDTVLMDPMCIEATCSDADGAFITSLVRTKDFGRKYPWAERKSFNSDDQKLAGDWFSGDYIIVAEYWKVVKTFRKLLLLSEETGETKYLDEYPGGKLETEQGIEILVLPSGERIPIVRSRKCEERKVIQYITNGIEILEENAWAGKYIPIVPCFGKEMWIDEGQGAKRKLFSLIRLARDPFMFYCYLRTKQAEEAAMTPLVPWIGYKGQFESDKAAWTDAHRIPVGMLEADPMVDAASGTVLPLPTRVPFRPNFAEYEIACEAAKRAIQSACGMFNSSVGKHDTQVKSGVLQEKLDRQSAQGNFHFIDNYHRFIQQIGVVIDDLLKPILDTPGREIGMREPDDSLKMVKLNDPNYKPEGSEEPVHYDTQKGEHDVNISVGEGYDSQREEINNFLNTLMANIKTLPIPPQQATQLLSLAIRMKNFGPLGDEIADMLSPKDKQQELPPEVMQAMAKLKEEATGLNEYAKQLEEKNKELEMEKKGNVINNEYKLEMNRQNNETKVLVAEIGTKAQALIERMGLFMDMFGKLHDSSHEAGMQADAQRHGAITQAADHEHTADMAREAAATSAAQQQTQIAADQQAAQPEAGA